MFLMYADALEQLQQRMRRAKTYERPGIILGAYKEIVEMRRVTLHKEAGEDGEPLFRKEVTYHRNNGPCRKYYERSDENKKKMVAYLHEQMIRSGSEHCAARLQEQLLKDLSE